MSHRSQMDSAEQVMSYVSQTTDIFRCIICIMSALWLINRERVI